MASEALEQRFKDLQDRLATLQDATTQLKEQIDHLANFNFQPGSVSLGASEDDNVGSELSTEINHFLREHEEELELLDEEIEDVHPGKGGQQHEKDRLRDGAQRLNGELHSCRIAFRKAQISAKRNLRLAQKQERELLFASFAAPRSGASSPAPSIQSRRRQQRPRSEMSKEEHMVSAGNDVLFAMQRTHELMAAELSRSDFAHKTLKESSEALGNLGENYSNLDTMLAGSRELLGTLMSSQKSDTWYLETSFRALMVTLGWLVFRRFLYGPAWWLVWLPLKLIFRIGMFTSSGIGLHGASQLDVTFENLGAQVGSQSVEMNNEGVPTIQVGQEQPTHEPEQEENSGSIMEEVGRMVDESKDAIVQEQAPELGPEDADLSEALTAVGEGEGIVSNEPEPKLSEPERVRVEL